MRRRRNNTLSHELLERRRVLSADFSRLSAGSIGRLEWQGLEVDAYQDRWVVRYDAPAGGLRSLSDLVVADGRWGWSVVELGGGLHSLSTPGAIVENVTSWAATAQGISYLEPDFAINRSLLPNDPSFSQLWGLSNSGQSGGVADADIDAPEAWNVTTGSRSVVIGVIDTGIDISHPDLAANIWRNPGEIPGNGIDDDGNGFVDDVSGWDFVSNDNDPQDGNGHGTHVAGTIGATGNDGRGIVGVNWQVSLLPLKFLSDSGSGSTAAAIAAINYATDLRTRGVNIVATNNSWGGGGSSTALRDAIRRHGDAGIVFVAAAGNESNDNDASPSYPANYNLPNVISVAALDRSDRLASFSNYGATTVHVGAPGVAIYSTTPGNRYSSYNGTSMAAPHVAGVVGLLAAANPRATVAEIRSAILDSAVPIPSLTGRASTGGRVNAAAALERISPVAGPRLVSLRPGGEVEPPVTSIELVFSEAITAAALVPANFLLTGAGPDGSFGTGDDRAVVIPAGGVVQSAAGTVTIALGNGLAEDAYRLRLVGTGVNPIRNLVGEPLLGGVDVVRTFTVRVVPPPPPAPFEPNDTIATATPGLLSGRADATFSGVIGDGANGSRDIDLFSVVLGAGETIEAVVVAQANGSTLDSYLRLFDAGGRQLAVNDDFGGSLDSRLTLAVNATGTYYVGVSGYGNSGYSPVSGSGRQVGSTGAYELRLRRASPPLEPNDSLARATNVAPTVGTVSVSGFVGDGAYRSADVDLFRISLGAGQSMTADIAARTIGSRLDSFLRLFDGDGRQLALNDDHGGSLDSYLTFTAPAAGTFFVGVSGFGNSWYLPAIAGSGQAGSTGDYRLDLTFSATPEPPPTEPPPTEPPPTEPPPTEPPPTEPPPTEPPPTEPPPTEPPDAGVGTVVGRQVFYNGSVFDGSDLAVGAADDASIASDKRPLLPGETASFVNYTSYSRGINGIMVDIAGLPGTPTVDDFAFRVGPSGPQQVWRTAPAPASVTIREAAGVNGSTRITITWSDAAVLNTWLEVTVRATPATGLARPDVFAFGNAVGEVGNSTTDATVTWQDARLISTNRTTSATITNRYDINRDGRVDFADLALASLGRSTPRSALPLISLGAAAIAPLQSAAAPPRFSVFELVAMDGAAGGRRSAADLFRLISLTAGDGAVDS